MRLQPGDSFDRYVIEALLGEGGMGEVYQARDTRLQRRVALKVLRKEAAAEPDAWARALARMEREARAAAALSHPNTVAIHDIGEHDGVPYLAMEFIEGLPLRRLIGGPASVTTRLSWLLDVARGLSAAHRIGLIHRDIKPENVMLRADGTIKVLDFGIVRKIELELDTSAPTQQGVGDTVTGEGVMVGTPAYMAPEQLRGEAIDARTDQFGWGVMAYELLTGRIPFGHGLEGVRLLSAILTDDPPPLEGIVPQPVERVLRRALAKKTADRFPSMDHIVEALSPFVSAQEGGPSDVLIAEAEPRRDAPQGPIEPAAPTLRGAEVFEPRRRSTTPPPPQVETRVATDRPPPVHTVRSPNVAGLPSPSSRTTAAPVHSTTLESPGVAASPRRLRAWYKLAGGALVLVVAAAGITRLLDRKSATPSDPGPVLSAPSVVPTPITELPMPSPSKPEALSAYREGLQALRDASWEAAYNAFERATKADASLGAAHLRMAMIDRFRGRTTSTRLAFQRAVQLRSSLGARDEALLDAFEPLLQRDPPVPAETVSRLEAATRRYPGDAELVQWLIVVQVDAAPQRLLELSERCVTLDPKYADCWQSKAQALFRLDRQADALAALDQCIDTAPAAADCLFERIRIHKSSGPCERLEADAKLWLAKAPGSAPAYRELALSLFAQGKPVSTVRAAIEQAERQYRELGMPEWAGKLALHHAVAAGDFTEAERLARELERAVDADPLEERHSVPALFLLDLYEETGRAREGGAVAERFLSRRDVWTRPVKHTPWEDPAIVLLAAKRRAGMLTDAEYAAARERWIHDWEREGAEDLRVALWFAGQAMPARTAEEARAALAARPDLQPLQFYAQPALSLLGLSPHAVLGRLYTLADRPGEALPYLTAATAGCNALDDIFRDTHAYHHLGVVREALGDKAGACAAYGVVLARWGSVKSSRTARDAARRVKGLACKL